MPSSQPAAGTGTGTGCGPFTAEICRLYWKLVLGNATAAVLVFEQVGDAVKVEVIEAGDGRVERARVADGEGQQAVKTRAAIVIDA